MKTEQGRRAGMTNRALSRRARTILAMDSLMLSVDNNPRRITKQDIATSAANWTVDELDMFADPGEDEYEDYYQIIEALMHIVHALNHGGGE